MKRVFAAILVVLMVVFALAACSQPNQTPATESTTAQVSQSAQATVAASGTKAAPSWGDPSKPADHPIYKDLTPVELDGLESPNIASRANIAKALPTAVRDKSKPLTIGFSLAKKTSDYFVELEKGIADECKKYGFNYEYTDANNDITKQSADVDTFITKHVDVLILHPVDSKANAVDVQKAVAAGIPVFASGNAFLPDTPVVTGLQSNSFWGGWDAGIELGKAMGTTPVNGSVLMGTPGAPISEGRINGMICGFLYVRYQSMGMPFTMKEDAMMQGTKFYQELRKNGKATLQDADLSITGIGKGDFTVEGGMSAFEDLLTGNPKMNVLFSDNDLMGEGATQVMESQGVKPGQDIKVICAADGACHAIQLVQQGKLLTTGYSNSYQNGMELVDLINNVFYEGYNANNMPVCTSTPLYAITKENADKFYDPNNTLPKVQPFEWKTIDQLNAEAAAPASK